MANSSPRRITRAGSSCSMDNRQAHPHPPGVRQAGRDQGRVHAGRHTPGDRPQGCADPPLGTVHREAGARIELQGSQERGGVVPRPGIHGRWQVIALWGSRVRRPNERSRNGKSLWEDPSGEGKIVFLPGGRRLVTGGKGRPTHYGPHADGQGGVGKPDEGPSHH